MKITLKPDKKKIVSYILQIAVFIVLITVISFWQTRNLLNSGSPAPAVKLTSLEGKNYTIPVNKTVVVYFFAPWCRICKFTNSSIKSIYESYKNNKNVDIIAVGLSWNSLEALHKYKKKNEMLMDVYEGTKVISDQFRISAYPTIYIIKDGKIKTKLVGYTTYPGLKIRMMIL